MKTSPIETMFTEKFSGCRYHSDVDQAAKKAIKEVEARFPNASITEIMYYLEKAAGAKKKAIRSNIIG